MEKSKKLARKIIAKIPNFLEKIIGIILLVGVIYGGFNLIMEAMDFSSAESAESYLEDILNAAFNVVLVIEFVRMLVKHSMSTIIEVLIFAIARGLVAGHEEPLFILIRVSAIAVLFFIRKYLFKDFDFEEEE
ncbi:hypothetical protein [Lachnospira pectinoschiza]|uniref:Transporter n=1 Tax=Lachnospira pectinoschiza TaxID=28052 RepID=A0A1G9T503_9FIRM|nr:hypothetical protein [Lachnospira pectinoschiza]SDM42696.1 hypothetical protein SAMN05216544_0212 [Lachnospira pectinoschiza]